MGLLSSLLPGLRDLRTPLASGLLWLAVIATVVAPRSDQILSDGPEARAIKELLSAASGTAAVPAIVSISFLLGCVASTLSRVATKLAASAILRMLAAIGERYKSASSSSKIDKWLRFRVYRNALKLKQSLEPISLAARRLIIDATQNIFSRAKAPGSASLIYPIGPVIDSIGYSAAHLAVATPSLYQEYDRFRSEAEFRVAIVPPLITLAAVLPFQHRTLIITFTTVGCCILLAQAVQQVRSSNNILANAAYIDHGALPNVQSVADALKELRPQPETEGEWIGAVIAVLEEKGLWDEAATAIKELSDYRGQQLEDAAWYLRENSRVQFDDLVTMLGERDDPHQEGILHRLRDAQRLGERLKGSNAN